MSYSIEPKNRLRLSLDKILFLMACFYFGLVIAWLVHQGKLRLPGMTPVSQTMSQAEQLSLENIKFIAYVQQSLNVIERKTKALEQAKSSSTMPTAIVSVPPPPSPVNSSTRVIERVYVPIYPQNSNSVSVIPSQIPTNVSSPLPPPPPSLKPSPVIPTTPTSVPIITPRDTSIAVAPPTNTGNKLVGVLELGNQSSALFDSNGITKRIAIGEEINGWKLVNIQNQQAFLERNGKQQILDVGRSF